jgi:hypothetical protein
MPLALALMLVDASAGPARSIVSSTGFRSCADVDRRSGLHFPAFHYKPTAGGSCITANPVLFFQILEMGRVDQKEWNRARRLRGVFGFINYGRGGTFASTRRRTTLEMRFCC